MVATPSNEELEILTVRTREDILRLLFDKTPRSPYKIAKEINMTTATVIDHLNKLEEMKLVCGEDTTKGHLRRKSYNITEKGKKIFLAFVKDYLNKTTKNEEIAKEVASFLGKV
jgi:DNA-binding MarR family transcriptional regulator